MSERLLHTHNIPVPGGRTRQCSCCRAREDELHRLREALRKIAESHAYERGEGRRDPVQHCTQLIRIAEDALNEAQVNDEQS